MSFMAMKIAPIYSQMGGAPNVSGMGLHLLMLNPLSELNEFYNHLK